ncbi:MAG: hypothetical protein KGZ25_13335, partial [Planctomycetes bacterium]|nr:hypothetical protein [Planctomycetota bacterium]
DENGNLIDDGWYHYGYDALNRLVRVSESDAPAVTLAQYSYDTNNRRITREVTHSDELNGTTRYVYDGWQVVEERGGGGSVEKTYTYGNYIDEPISLTTEEGTFYYHTNNLYNVRAMTDDSGEVVERYRYSAYGEPTILDNQGNERSASAVGNAYMFQGRRYDPESRLYYYRHRHYWPELGRFLQRDPISVGQIFAWYSGLANQPMKYMDPTGLQAIVTGSGYQYLSFRDIGPAADRQARALFKRSLKADSLAECMMNAVRWANFAHWLNLKSLEKWLLDTQVLQAKLAVHKAEQRTYATIFAGGSFAAVGGLIVMPAVDAAVASASTSAAESAAFCSEWGVSAGASHFQFWSTTGAALQKAATAGACGAVLGAGQQYSENYLAGVGRHGSIAEAATTGFVGGAVTGTTKTVADDLVMAINEASNKQSSIATWAADRMFNSLSDPGPGTIRKYQQTSKRKWQIRSNAKKLMKQCLSKLCLQR